MAHSRKYKRLEKNIVSRIMHAFRLFFVSIGRVCTNVVKFFDGKLTLMIVPHSQGKVFSVQTNIFALVLGIILAIGITGSFVYFNQKNASSGLEISRLRDENRETLASLDELRDENNNLLQTAKKFQSTLSQSLSLLGINQNTGTSKSAGRNSDLSSLFDTQDITSGSLKETSDIKQLTAYLESAVRPVEQIGKMLENQGALFSDIPNVWPVKNGIGHISMEFGQNQHPITQQWYIHKGLDFSTWRQGDPVIATANGQVVTVTYDDSFGLYVIIKHKHGIYTRYAHLGTTRVKKGDTVAQRQIIGTIGNTGITTGPHLHYEVHIGSDVVDPAKYINVK
ncbi:MAG: M23 family metallopeptidase [Spirochaetales bacterium]|nr:M23 family metallopeptidase [Spirochaetales bacterium]